MLPYPLVFHKSQDLTISMTGKLYWNKGYISADLFKKLFERCLHLVIGIKKNIKKNLMSWADKLCLRKRSIIENVFDYIKNKFELEYTRHRSVSNAFVRILSVLIAYTLKPTKPLIKFDVILPT